MKFECCRNTGTFISAVKCSNCPDLADGLESDKTLVIDVYHKVPVAVDSINFITIVPVRIPMKKINEMTHDEIINLDSQQLNDLVDLECAERGVRLMSAPVKPILPKLPDQDLIVYTVFGVKTTNKFVAEQLEELLTKFKDQLTEVDKPYKWSGLLPDDAEAPSYARPLASYAKDTSICRSFVYTHKVYLEEVEPLLSAMVAKNESYLKDLKVYKEVSAARSAIADDIYSYYEVALKLQRELETMENHFKQYLHLANGVRDLAKKFFKLAYQPDRWVTEKLFPEDNKNEG